MAVVFAATATSACTRCNSNPGPERSDADVELRDACDAAFQRAVELLSADPHIAPDRRAGTIAELESQRAAEVDECISLGRLDVAECRRDAPDLFAWGRCAGLADPPAGPPPSTSPDRALCERAADRSLELRGPGAMSRSAMVEWCTRESTEVQARCVAEADDEAALTRCGP